MVNISISKGDLSAAENECKNLLDKHPDVLPYQIKSAQILFYQGAFDKTDNQLREIVEKLPLDDMAVNDILDVMYKIQRLDPPGVGARNMQECLLAQAEFRDENALAIIILKEHFDNFANHRYEKILESCDCSKEELNEAMEFISRLNPSPRDDQLALSRDIVVPDISVEDKAGKYHVVVRETSLPEIRVSPSYRKMLNSHKDKKDKMRKIF